MILVAGLDRSGTDGDPERIEANVPAMTDASLRLLDHGRDDDAEVFQPVAERLLEHGDACLHIGGPSAGAERMVETARRMGLDLCTDIGQVP